MMKRVVRLGLLISFSVFWLFLFYLPLSYFIFYSRARVSTLRFVRWSVVHPSIYPSVVHISLFYDFYSLTLLLLLKWSSNLNMAPAQLHMTGSTGLAVYPFFFSFGQRPRRDRWPMLSHRGTFSFSFFSFSFSFSSSSPPPRTSSLKAQNPASRLKILLWGPNAFSSVHPFEAHILALRLKSQPWGPNSNLEAQILASRPKS